MKTVTVTIFLAMGASFAVLADPPKEVMSITRPDDVAFRPSPIVPGAAAGSFVLHHRA